MTDRVILIATLTEPPAAGELSAARGRADVLEVRADLAGELDPEALRRDFGGRLLYTLRSTAEGGRGPDAAESRRERLVAAAGRYDLVDLEAERDLGPSCLKGIAAERRVLSWHGPTADLDALRERCDRMLATPARYYKLVIGAESHQEALLPLALLHSLGRRDVLAFAGGRVGLWSRLLAPRLGAPLAFGALREASPGAPGQPGIERLREDYGLPELPSLHDLYGIVGRPIDHSLSPRLHNRLYAEQGLPALFLPFHAETFGDFWLDLVESGSLDVLGFRLSGLSVTAPFKEIAQAVAGASSPLAERVGSANTLVRHSGVWEAESTDPEGIVGPVRERGLELAERPVAVVGAGGAGRAAAFGLARLGARVTLLNRGVERGRRVADELGVEFRPLADIEPERYSLLVNATPLGRDGNGELPFEPRGLPAGTVVMDMAYLPDGPTRLVREAAAAGCQAVDGREVLLHQAVPQYLIMTGQRLPLELGRRLLGLDPEP